MNRKIHRVAVLGAGVMGSRIACHMAGTGHEVLLLDMASTNLSGSESTNANVQKLLASTLKLTPSQIYDTSMAKRIEVGNFDDDLSKIKDCDWVIEAITEDLEVKRKLYRDIELVRKKGTIISTNTSGIPIRMLLVGRTEDFAKCFCGTHFFNPPRYLRLLEIIPGPNTDEDIISFLMSYGFTRLGKETIVAHDTPGFIGNRIGVYSLLSILSIGLEMGLGFGEIDDLTGRVIGRAKSATFRTADIVGIDTLINVATNLKQMLPKDESVKRFSLHPILSFLGEKGWLGEKNGQGFYKKEKGEGSKKTQILEIDPTTKEYRERSRASYDSLRKAKSILNLGDRLRMLCKVEDALGIFYKTIFSDLFRYASMRIPEISRNLYSVDKAVSAGFNWEKGPFELWDMLGVEDTVKVMEALSLKPSEWVYEMLKAGVVSFYRVEKGRKQYYDIFSKSYDFLPSEVDGLIVLSDKQNSIVWQNESATLIDIGDGIVNMEIHTKMNAIDSGVLHAIQTCVALAEKKFKGMVIGTESENFSVGANISALYMYATQQEFDEIAMAITHFQQATSCLRYATIPVVAALSGLTLGGGCEIAMHATSTQAYVETYIGLVETGVGLIPAGGGTKELARLASERYIDGDIELNVLEKFFKQVAMARTSTSSFEGVKMGYLSPSITFNRRKLISDAKWKAVSLATSYVAPLSPKIRVQGQSGLAGLEAAITGMLYANYISDYDAFIARKLSYVFCGGDLTSPQDVSESYMLELEREAFVSLCGEKKTQERIHSILFEKKPLRN